MAILFEFIEEEKEGKISFRLICYRGIEKFSIDLNNEGEVKGFLGCYGEFTAHNVVQINKSNEKNKITLNLKEYSEICIELFIRVIKLYTLDQK